MSKYEKPIMRAAREQFSELGYYGARIDAIAECAEVNKRMIYDFCQTKDNLYLAVLSEVSREAMSEINKHLDEMEGNLVNIYGVLFNTLENHGDFLRLWAWERLSPTIHGPRILETVNAIFEKIRHIIETQSRNGKLREVTPSQFEAIEGLAHGFLLTAAMYFRCDPETDRSEQSQPSADGLNSPALRRLNLSMHTQSIVLESIDKFLNS